MKKSKLVVIGAGGVGATTAFTFMLKGMFSEIAIIDLNREKAEGEALDMMHGVSFTPAVQVYAGDYKDCKGADFVIITAGAPQRKNESRRDLLGRNAKIMKSVVSEVIKYISKKTFIITVTNPVDVLSYYVYKISGMSASRVIGTGTVLDTSRLKYALSKHTGIDTGDIEAFVLGEHGDSEVSAWSKTSIVGMSIPEFCNVCGKCSSKKLEDIFKNVKNAAYDIIAKKGSTYYAIAMATERIIEAIRANSNSVLTISTLLSGQYGISDIYLSVPTVVNAKGAEEILEIPLTNEEISKLRDSSKEMKKLCKEIGI